MSWLSSRMSSHKSGTGSDDAFPTCRDDLELSLKLYHARELHPSYYQQSIAEAPWLPSGEKEGCRS